MTKRRMRGFTVVEVLCALAIAAIGLGALVTSVGKGIRQTQQWESRVLGHFVLHHTLHQWMLHHRAERVAPEQVDQTVSLGGFSWQVRQTVAHTPQAGVFAVHVVVSDPNGRLVAQGSRYVAVGT